MEREASSNSGNVRTSIVINLTVLYLQPEKNFELDEES